jgi:hypothetical protein
MSCVIGIFGVIDLSKQFQQQKTFHFYLNNHLEGGGISTAECQLMQDTILEYTSKLFDQLTKLDPTH